MRRHRTLVALACLLVILPPSASIAADLPYQDVQRINAKDATDAAIVVSQQLFADNSTDAVVLARNDAFPDGLGASALTSSVRGPLLLTGSSVLPSRVRDEIVRVLREGGTVYLLGGTAAISASVEAEIERLGFRTPRFPGRDRIETAALIARFIGEGPGATVLLARARGIPDNQQGWVDSVSCGGFAAQSTTPILLTSSTDATVSSETLETMAYLGIRRVSVCGGASAIPEAQVTQLREIGLTVDRYSGVDRAATAVAVAEGLWNVTNHNDERFVLVPGFGTQFGFGLVAAQLSAALDAPILLVDRDVPTSCGSSERAAVTLCYLEQGSGEGDAIIVLGATSLISDEVVIAAAEAANLPRDSQPPTVPKGLTFEDPAEDEGDTLIATWSASSDISPPITYEVLGRPSDAEGKLTAANATIAFGTQALQATLTGLVAGTSYDFAIRATDRHANVSGLSAVVTVTPVDEVPASPPPDVGPTVVPHGSAGINVSWTGAPEADVDGYHVQRLSPGLLVTDCSTGLIGGEDWQTIATVAAPATSYHDDAAASGEDFCYRYAIVDTTENVTDWSGATGPVTAT